MTITAKYRGTCRDCGRRIAKGETIVVAVTEPDAGVTVEMGLAVFESVNADLDELDQVRELEVDQELTIGGGAAPLFVVRRIA